LMNSVVAQGQTCFTNEGPQLRLVATNLKGLSTHEYPLCKGRKLMLRS
jgi:hypothetical protein